MSNNPYRPPESNLDLPVKQLRESIWWKVYFVLSILMTLLAFLGVALVDGLTVSVFDYVDSGFSLVALIGVFGFAFSIPIGKPDIWSYFFYLFVVETLFYSLALPISGEARFGEVAKFDGMYAFETAYLVPLIWALYLYAFKRNKLWENA